MSKIIDETSDPKRLAEVVEDVLAEEEQGVAKRNRKNQSFRHVDTFGKVTQWPPLIIVDDIGDGTVLGKMPSPEELTPTAPPAEENPAGELNKLIRERDQGELLTLAQNVKEANAEAAAKKKEYDEAFRIKEGVEKDLLSAIEMQGLEGPVKIAGIKYSLKKHCSFTVGKEDKPKLYRYLSDIGFDDKVKTVFHIPSEVQAKVFNVLEESGMRDFVHEELSIHYQSLSSIAGKWNVEEQGELPSFAKISEYRTLGYPGRVLKNK